MSDVDVEKILEALPTQTSLEVISGYLRGRGLDHSASSWEQMIEERIKPAFVDGAIRASDIAELSREVEEHGNQHVFLYTLADPRKAKGLFDVKTLSDRINGLTGWPALNIPSYAQTVSSSQIVEVRLDETRKVPELVVKIVEPRQYRKKEKESKTSNRITIEYKLLDYRAVNVARFRKNGEMEIRIYSHKQSASYSRDVADVWKKLTGLFSRAHFNEYSLLALKDALWDENYKSGMKNRIGIRNSQLLNLSGNRLSVAAGDAQGNLWDDAGLFAGVREFSSGSKNQDCEYAHVALLHEHLSGDLWRDVSFTLKGEPNELIFPSSLARTEYEHALDFVRQPISSDDD